MLYKVSGINWDCDGEDPENYGLPAEDFAEADNEEEAINALSDKHGFFISYAEEVIPF